MTAIARLLAEAGIASNSTSTGPTCGFGLVTWTVVRLTAITRLPVCLPSTTRSNDCASVPTSADTRPRATRNDQRKRWRPAASASWRRRAAAWYRQARSTSLCDSGRPAPVSRLNSRANGSPNRCCTSISSTKSPASSASSPSARTAAAVSAAVLRGDSSSATQILRPAGRSLVVLLMAVAGTGFALLCVAAAQFGQMLEPLRHALVEAAFGLRSVSGWRSDRNTSQQLECFIHRFHRVDVETPCRGCLHHIAAQHQMGHVGGGNQHALLAAEAALGADVEVALDLLVYRADRLHPAELVDRAGHRQRLPDRHIRQRRQQRGELGHRGAVAFHLAVGLLEHQARRQRQRLFGGVAR